MLEEVDVLRTNNKKLQLLEGELLELRELQVQMLRLAGIERALGVDLDLLKALQEASKDTLQKSSGLLLWPVAGDLVRGHSAAEPGVRLHADPGRTLVASGEGVVWEFSPAAPGHLQIDHRGGFQTVYRNIAMALVAPGDSVLAGQIVGLVGQDGPYVQFEVYRDGHAVQPQDYVHQTLVAN